VRFVEDVGAMGGRHVDECYEIVWVTAMLSML
jgi:hypothetical protein